VEEHRSKTRGSRSVKARGRSFHPLSIKFRTMSAPKIAAISQAAITIFIRQFNR
jgi:hypothetical protein